MMPKHTEPSKQGTSDAVRRPDPETDDRLRFDFLASSLDLAQGLEVQDLSDVTIPGELVDSLFGASTGL